MEAQSITAFHTYLQYCCTTVLYIPQMIPASPAAGVSSLPYTHKWHSSHPFLLPNIQSICEDRGWGKKKKKMKEGKTKQ